MLAQIDLNGTTIQLEIDTFSDEENATYGVPLTKDIVNIQDEELLIGTDEAIRFMAAYNKSRNAVDWTFDDGNNIFITYLGPSATKGISPFEIWNDYEGSFDLFAVIKSEKITLIDDDTIMYF